MRLKKLFLACAAVTAIAAAMTTSAMAAPSAVYDGSGAVTISGFDLDEGQNTIVLLQGKNDDITTVVVDDIKYINQGEKDQSYFVTIPVNALADGDYTVRVGCEHGDIEFAEFTVGGSVTPPDGEEVLIGDVDESGRVTAGDAVVIAVDTASVESTLSGKAKFAAARCDGNNRVSAADAVEIAKFTTDLDYSGKVGQKEAYVSLD